MSRQTLMYVGLGGWLVLLWALLVWQRTNPLALVFVALSASPLLLLALRVTLEDGQPTGLFNPSRASWAFLFGDVVWLPLAMAACAYGQRNLPDSGWHHTSWWLPLCVLLGLGAGLAFHFLMDQPAYVQAGWGQALYSPTKVAHDFVSYPLLFGGLAWLGVPVLVHDFKWAGAVGLVGVLLWGAMGARDATHPPKPENLHPRWSVTDFRVNP